jgi:carboxypeptidase Q
VRLLKELGLRPRRTIRVVLYTNEENGLRGGTAYRDAYRNEVSKHILAIETDSGIYQPLGFGLAATAAPQARANMQEIAKLLSGIRADRIAADGGGADIGPMMREGVLGASLDVEGSHYFDIHHTPADTLDKIDPQNLALRCHDGGDGLYSCRHAAGFKRKQVTSDESSLCTQPLMQLMR